jgi:hypothetical protein
MIDVASKSMRRTLRLAACVTSAGMLVPFGGLAADRDSNVFAMSDGRIDRTRNGQFEVNTKGMRATINGTRGQSLRVRFTYLGPTQDVAKLADGSVRHQLVLALRAKDICNRVYIGWHFLTPSKHDQVVVQVKTNPGEVSHSDCGDSGYQTVVRFNARAVRTDEQHTFEASIENGRLAVNTDGAVTHVYLPAAAFDFDGPAALRSDNAHVIFSYEAE